MLHRGAFKNILLLAENLLLQTTDLFIAGLQLLGKIRDLIGDFIDVFGGGKDLHHFPVFIVDGLGRTDDADSRRQIHDFHAALAAIDHF